MFKPFKRKPQTVMAAYFEKAGTYDVGSTTVEVEADTYVVQTEDCYEVRDGKLFRAAWEPVGDPNPVCDECGGDLGGVELGRIESHEPGCSNFPL